MTPTARAASDVTGIPVSDTSGAARAAESRPDAAATAPMVTLRHRAIPPGPVARVLTVPPVRRPAGVRPEPAALLPVKLATGGATDGGPWRGPTTEEWLARITFGAHLLVENRRHAGRRPVVVGRRR